MVDGSDRTRFKKTVGNPKTTSHSKSDKTRVKSVSGHSVHSAQDKTRIAPSVKGAGDKTRMAADRPDKPQAVDDNTRFKPMPSSTAEKTRIKPVSKTDEFPTSLDPIDESSAVTLQAILKDRFVLEKVLGVGGMGVVYKARDRLKVEAQDRDPYVAIKVLNEEFKSHPEAFISLQRESRKSQRIAHPNIVNVFDFDRDQDTVFMTMEFLDGHPLDELINKYQSTGLPTDDAWQIIKDMSAALSYAHGEHIIHSDFKPGNVFVTKKGVAKVFDFGIARAVAQVEQVGENPQDLTVFDAGTLGALTPAYASLEMLQGEEPDVRDDIYALGCVAYEMLTGQHPYNKVPADEAERQGLKPKRINHIKKYQWRAIEKAIAFRREDRIESVDQFVAEISPKINPTSPWIVVLGFIVLIAGAAYFYYFQQQNSESGISEFDIRNELELKVRIDFFKDNILAQIKGADFSKLWQESIWKDLSDLKKLVQPGDPWVEEHEKIIYQLFVDKINTLMQAESFTDVSRLIEAAKNYTSDTTQLDGFKAQIARAVKAQQERQKAAALKQQKEKQALLARQLQQARDKQRQEKVLKQQEKQKHQFDVAMENVNTQLKCQGRLNMRDFETAIDKLKQLDARRYAGLKNKIISSLASCIVSIGKAFPDRAREARKHSMRIFNGVPVLAAIDIKEKDPCDISLAGLGARGKRSLCKDKLNNAATGPELVVIPGNSKIKAFAIGKYELSNVQMNAFCRQSSLCQPQPSSRDELPVSDIPLSVATAYLKWLSAQTGYRYRLPSKNEWLYAAKSRRKFLDANRNCELSTRGFEKGGELVKTEVGRQNSWGLVNYVGNVQEWVYDAGRKLVAVGGSYQQPMETCNLTTAKPHDGSADAATGLRVLRELRTD